MDKPGFCHKSWGIKNGPALAEQAFPDGQHAVASAEYSAEVSVSDQSSLGVTMVERRYVHLWESKATYPVPRFF